MLRTAKFLLPLVPVLLMLGCQKTEVAKTPAAPVAVSTVTVEPTTESAWVDVLGRVKSGLGTEIRSQITGRLVRVHFEPGRPVGQNEILYTIEEGSYRAKVADAQASMDTAASNLNKARRDAKRSEQLFRQNAISRQAYDDARTALANAEQNARASKARWQQAVIDLNHCSVRSPAAGIPALSRVNPGDMISAQSTLMTTLETPGDLRVVFTVADRLLKGAALGLENKVKLSTENNEPLQGHLDYLSPELGTDTAARTFRARLSEESLKKVLPGNFIRVRLETSRLDGVFRVPQKAVRQLDNGLYQVFVLRDGKALARSVTVGEWVDTDWIITGGLQAGDRVIVNQLLRLRDGMSVTENSTARP